MQRALASIGAALLAACGDANRTADADADADASVSMFDDGGDSTSDVAPGDGLDTDVSTAQRPHRVLFVGNSYTFVNDVPAHYRAMTTPLFSSVAVEQVVVGGYRLDQHAMDAATDGTPLARWLRTGSPDETAFDAVVLQEQSQIGGFPTFAPERASSVAAASELATLARAHGDMVVLYLTWGREAGDPTNASIGFATFTSMQDMLDDRYLGLAALLREQGTNVRVAPVGGAFRTVFEDVTRAGGDPSASGSDFDALYEDDGSHPSVRGAYLSACVIAGTTTETNVRDFADEPTLGPDVSRGLRDVCARTLADPRWFVPTIARPQGLVARGTQAMDHLGAAVSLTNDATRVVAGNSIAAANAWVFARSAAAWSPEAMWHDDGYLSVGSVAMSGDGQRVIVNRADPSAGVVPTVYVRSGSMWSEEAALGVTPGVSCPPFAVSLSDDGSRAAVGGGGCTSDTGTQQWVAARVFVRAGSSWALEAQLTSGGTAIDIDASGMRVIAQSANDALATVFTRTSAGWVSEGDLIADVPPEPQVIPPRIERALALSGDGARAVVGMPRIGVAVMFVRNGSTWTHTQTLSALADSQFGASVALSADGGRAVIGASSDSPAATGKYSGSARVYVLRDGSFRHERLLVPDAYEGALPQFGASVASSADGIRIIAGAPTMAGADGTFDLGAAYEFVVP